MDLLADIDPGPWASWAQIIAVILSVVGSLYVYDRRIQSRLDRQDATTDAIVARLERELGGNSGGLREAVNSLKTGQAAAADRLDAHLEAHAGQAHRWRDSQSD